MRGRVPGKLGLLLTRYLLSGEDLADAVVSSPALFPCCRPFDLQGELVPPKGGRRAVRFWEVRSFREYANMVAGVFSFLAVGSPKGTKWVKRDGNLQQTAAQQEFLKALKLGFRAFCREGVVSPSGGRVDLVSVLKGLSTGYGPEFCGLMGSSDGGALERPGAAILPIIADRLSLPKSGATFDIRSWIPEEWKKDLEEPARLLLDPPPTPANAGRVHGSEKEVLKYFKRMFDAGMLEVRDPRLLPVGPDGVSLGAGLFSVPKSDVKDRTIVDKRLQNSLERPWKCPRMGHGVALTRLVVGPDRMLRSSIFDLPDYYHTMFPGEEYVSYNQLGRPFAVSKLKAAGIDVPFGAELGQCCSRSVPMGDQKGVPIGQAVHVALLRSAGISGPVLEYGMPVRPCLKIGEDTVYTGVIIDDFLVVADVPRSLGFEAEGLDTFVGRSAMEAYEKVGLAPKPEKVHRRQAIIRAWGADLDGDVGVVGAPAAKIVQIAAISFEVAISDFKLSKRDWQRVVGGWSFPLMFKRPMFCLFGQIYRDIDKMPKKGKCHLSAEARSELFMMALLGPYLQCDLRAPVLPRLFSHDAEGSGGAGICEAPIPQHLADELWQFTDLKGAYTQLACEEFEGEDVELFQPGVPEKWRQAVKKLPLDVETRDKVLKLRSPWEEVVAELSPALPWKVFRAWRFKRGAHINVLETKTRTALIRRLASRRSTHGVRVLSLGDSRVALGASAKGRSSALKLNAALRLELPHVLGAQLQVSSFYAPTSLMIADAPSRKQKLPPIQPLPDHLRDPWAGRGCFVQPSEVEAYADGSWWPRVSRRVAARYGLRGARVGEASNPGPGRRRLVASDKRPLHDKFDGARGSQIYKDGDVALEKWLSESRDTSRSQLSEAGARECVGTLCEFIEASFSDDAPYGVAVHAVCGFQHEFWWWSNGLRPVWKLLDEWHFRLPVECRWPVPPLVVKAVIAVALNWGWFGFALIVYCAFHGLLRPGEAAALETSDFFFKNIYDLDTPTKAEFATLVVRLPKTRKKGPRRQQVLLEDRLLITALQAFCDAAGEGSVRLFGFGEPTFLDRWHRVCDVLEIKGQYVVAGLRAGGATHDYLTLQNIPRVRFRGRWAAEKSLEHYLQGCMSFIGASKFSPSALEKLRACAAQAEVRVMQLVADLRAGRVALFQAIPSPVLVGSKLVRAALKAKSRKQEVEDEQVQVQESVLQVASRC